MPELTKDHDIAFSVAWDGENSTRGVEVRSGPEIQMFKSHRTDVIEQGCGSPGETRGWPRLYTTDLQTPSLLFLNSLQDLNHYH